MSGRDMATEGGETPDDTLTVDARQQVRTHRADALRPSREPAAAARDEPEPRWPAIVATVAAGGLYFALPAGLTIGPRWAFPLLVGVLLASTVGLHRVGHHRLDRALGFALIAILTSQMILSLVLLVGALPSHVESPNALLVSAASLWTTNVLVFALWYWRLDAGGPHGRDQRENHAAGAFLFPPMMLSPKARRAARVDRWSPNFVDYLFLAFNTSTAFSPTDTAVLSRWAKILTMLQALISLAVLALLAARAVNIL